MLRIRYSSPLFRLTSAEAILHQVSFGNSGTDQVCSPLRATSCVFLDISNAVRLGGSGAADTLAVLRPCSDINSPLACPFLNALADPAVPDPPVLAI